LFLALSLLLSFTSYNVHEQKKKSHPKTVVQAVPVKTTAHLADATNLRHAIDKDDVRTNNNKGTLCLNIMPQP
jgi:hypothetical protein